MPKRTAIANPEPVKLLRRFLEELEWCSTRKYVELLRGRGDLLSIGEVDVDLPQLVLRHFKCDARRCIEWDGDAPLVDRSCCSRYKVPLSRRDCEVVTRHLEQVRPLLLPGYRMLDPEEDPFRTDDEYGPELCDDNPLGGCEFNLYQEGRCRCALHSAALAAGENPLDWKPVACALWPLAVSTYQAEKDESRLLLTVYCEENEALFDGDDDPFACLVDQNPSYPRTYQSERATLEYLFGEAWWAELDRAALGFLRERER
jgi:hypothetical protein